MTHSLTDAQIHEAALSNMRQNGVSYADALQNAVVIAKHRAGDFSEASFAEPDDVKVHAAAMLYSAQHAVSYAEALQCVVITMPVSMGGAFSEQGRMGTQLRSDAAVDAAAKAYAVQHRVSYSEALNCVQFDGMAEYSEAATALKSPAASAVSNDAAQVLAQQQIEIFQAGTRSDNTGNVYTVTPEEVQRMAMGYNIAKHEAPLTIGHPSDNQPAYGWVKSLQATPDGRLLMQADQIDPAFAEMVKLGRFKKRSASFYPPLHPGNPNPGNWYLRHVAWLGAMPPAVRGMPDAAFSAQGSDGFISF